MTMFGRLLASLRRIPQSGTIETWRGLAIEFDARAEIGVALRHRGCFEQQEIDLATALFLSRYPGRTIVDVGANVGIHALAWARGLGVRVNAFEPAPRTYELLRRNVERNGLGTIVRLHRVAVCDTCGEVEFFVANDDAYSSMKDTHRRPVREVIRVPSTTLDVLRAAMDPVGLVKIDVEGLESAVIAGGREMIRRDRPVMFVEIYKGTHSNADPGATVATIMGLGYDAFVFSSETGLVPYERHDDARYNYFFIPKT